MKTKLFIFVLVFLLFVNAIVLANVEPIPVKVIEVSNNTIEIRRIINGVIEPYKNILISTQIAGVVDEMMVEVGEMVNADQVLLRFDQEQLLLQLAQAEATLKITELSHDILVKGASEEDRQLAELSYQHAEISYQAAQTNLEYAKSMYEDRTIQQQQLLSVQTQLDAAEIQYKLAEERYTQSEIAQETANDDYERMNYLYENGIITKKQFETTEAQFKNVKSALVSANLAKIQAEASYLSAQENYALTLEIIENRTTAQQQVDSAMAQLEIAKANLQIAEENIRKIENGASEEQLKTSEASLEQAKVAVNLVKLQLKNSIIKAPVSGVIAQINYDEGEMAAPGTPAIVIIDIDQLYLKADASPDILSYLEIGQETRVKIRVFPDSFVMGKIAQISPIVDPRTQAYPVKILLQNQDHKIKPGMFAEADLILEEVSNATIVPLDAVLDLDSFPYLYVVKLNSDGKTGLAKKRSVEIGLVTDDKIEIKSGLEKGELIVIMGQNSLVDSEQVEVTD